MENYRVILAGGLDFAKADSSGYLLGQAILEKVLNKDFSTKHLYFDYLHRIGELTYETNIEDTYEKLAEYILAFNPEVIGFHTMASSFCNIVELAELIHEKNPNVVIFFGGPHASVTAEECLRVFPWLAAVCRGESEKIITPFIKALIYGNSLYDIPQISFRDKDKIISNPNIELLSNEELKNYTLVDADQTMDKDIPIFLEGGRGCPFTCTFCATNSFWGRCFRIKPIQDLIDEMDAYNNKYGSHSFIINHDNFTTNKQHILDFCNALIAKQSPYTWNCSSRIDLIDREIAEKMALSGCSGVYFGIETGSARMQKLINKNIDLSQVYEKMDLMKSNKIPFTTSFIYGFPQENEEDFDDTLTMLENIYTGYSANVQLHILVLLPCTEETAKIYDETYFDINDNWGDVTLSDTITEKSIERIINNKSLFIQNYNFHTIIRDKYREIGSLVSIFQYLKKYYPHTCKKLVSKYGFKKIFLMDKKLMEDIEKDNASSDKVSLPHTYWSKHLERITQLCGDFGIQELFRIERDIDQYFSSKKPTESFIAEYGIDLKQAIYYGIMLKRHAKYEFCVENGERIIREIDKA